MLVAVKSDPLPVRVAVSWAWTKFAAKIPSPSKILLIVFFIIAFPIANFSPETKGRELNAPRL